MKKKNFRDFLSVKSNNNLLSCKLNKKNKKKYHDINKIMKYFKKRTKAESFKKNKKICYKKYKSNSLINKIKNQSIGKNKLLIFKSKTKFLDKKCSLQLFKNMDNKELRNLIKKNYKKKKKKKKNVN